jgi:hypothetical protein
MIEIIILDMLVLVLEVLEDYYELSRYFRGYSCDITSRNVPEVCQNMMMSGISTNCCIHYYLFY